MVYSIHNMFPSTHANSKSVNLEPQRFRKGVETYIIVETGTGQGLQEKKCVPSKLQKKTSLFRIGIPQNVRKKII